MKLIRLHVSNYKNLKDIEIDFSKSNGCALLIGTNGSGKSNLLEVLSAIFSALYNQKDNVSPDFRFELEYKIERMRTGSFAGDKTYSFPLFVKVWNKDGKIAVLYHSASDEIWDDVNRKEYEIFLPEHVVAVYSGEEQRLWEDYYFKAYEEFNKQYIKSVPRAPQRLLYINKYYWNLIASMLTIYDDPEYEKFLDDLGLHIEGIECKFDITKMINNKNAMASEMLEIINPEGKEEVYLTIDKIKQLQDVCGYESDVFYNLLVLVLYKQYKIITDYKIKCKDNMSIRNLSEGEKKRLLIFGATHIINGENLFLFDEPDAHIHEGRKKDIFEQLIYSGENQYGITSHSPTMTTMFDNDNIILFTKNNDEINVEDKNKIQEIKDLTNGEWNYIDQSIFFNSKKPLLIVEGKSDVNLIRRAIKVFGEKSEYAKYKKLDFQYLFAGGTGNIPDVYNEIKNIDSSKNIIVLCDDDNSGSEALKKLNADEFDKGKQYKKVNNTYFAKLIHDKINGNYIIEDYLPKSLLKSMTDNYLSNKQYKSFSSFPTIKKNIKEEICNKANTYSYDNLKSMEVLLEFLYNIYIDMGYIKE